jgi:hypothetical protein
VLNGWTVILILKTAVVGLTLLLLASFVPLLRGDSRLHGRINIVFFGLTVSALLALEVLVRLVQPRLFDYFDAATAQALKIHLCFALPAAALLPAMLFTGLTHRRGVHLALAVVFGALWAGTVITGVFLLPHTPPATQPAGPAGAVFLSPRPAFPDEADRDRAADQS